MCGCKTSTTTSPKKNSGKLPLPKYSLPTPPQYYSSSNAIEPFGAVNQLYFSINSSLDTSKLSFYGKYNIDVALTPFKGFMEGKQDLTGNFEMDVPGSEVELFWKEKCLWKNEGKQVLIVYAGDCISYQALPEDSLKFVEAMEKYFIFNENTQLTFNFSSADDFNALKNVLNQLLNNAQITSKLSKITFSCEENIDLGSALTKMNPVNSISCSKGCTNENSISFILTQNVGRLELQQFDDELVQHLKSNKLKLPKQSSITVQQPEQLNSLLDLLQSDCMTNVEILSVVGIQLFDNDLEKQKEFGSQFLNSNHLNLKKLAVFANFENFSLRELFQKPKFQNLVGLELWDISEQSFEAFSGQIFPQLEYLKTKVAGFASEERFPKIEKSILNILKNNNKLKVLTMDKMESILFEDKNEGLYLDFSEYSYMTANLLTSICQLVGQKLISLSLQFEFMIMLGGTIGTDLKDEGKILNSMKLLKECKELKKLNFNYTLKESLERILDVFGNPKEQLFYSKSQEKLWKFKNEENIFQFLTSYNIAQQEVVSQKIVKVMCLFIYDKLS